MFSKYWKGSKRSEIEYNFCKIVHSKLNITEIVLDSIIFQKQEMTFL